MSSQFDDNSLTSTSVTINNTQKEYELEQNASDENTASTESFQHRKQFWENFDHPILPLPIPKPRSIQIKDSFDTDISSLRSLPDSKQESRDEDSYVPEEKIEDESFPASDRYDWDTSERKEASSVAILVTDLDKIDISETSETDISEIDAAKFYIGESSDNVIKRTSTDKRTEFAFDNHGYQISVDDVLHPESGPKSQDFFHEEIEIYDDEIISGDIKDIHDVKSHLRARSTAEDSREYPDLEEKSEFEVSEKLSRTQSEDKPEEHPVAVKRPQVIHSPVKHETSFVMEKSIEITQESVIVAQASPIEVVKDAEPEIKRTLKLEGYSEMPSKDSFRLDTKRTDEELAVEKTLEEVEDSLDAVQEELIEVIKDGTLIKQSPSEFEINILPDLTYPASIPEQEELPETPKKDPIVKIREPKLEKSKLSEAEESQLSSNEESFNKLETGLRHQKTKHGSNRWSVTDIESSSESHYQSFEKTDSRPLSSDVENLVPYQSSEYETAHDQSTVHGSTLDYHSAVSTLHSRSISSRDSMKSLDSESSGNLASIEASETSETLVPSTMEECEENLQSDLLSHPDVDFDDRDRFTSLESEIASSKSEDISPPIAPAMKRSHEMTFASGVRPIIGSVEILPDTRIGDTLARSVEDLKYGSWEEARFGSSLEEGSMLSVSISSASNLETMVEIHPEHADMMGSLVGSFESAKIYTSFTDDATEMTPPEHQEGAHKFDSITMTTSSVMDEEQNNVNTQITTTFEDISTEPIKKRGHKRTDSTSVFAGGFIKAGSKESSDSFDDDNIPQEDSDVISSEKDETHGESSDSDYDRYESEYARSFRSPMTSSSKSKSKEVDEKKTFSPGHSIIETIVEDVHAEIEHSTEIRDGSIIVKPHEYDIPNIQVTEEIGQEIDFNDEQIEAETEVAQTVQYAKQVEYKITEEEYQDMLAKKYQSRLADLTKSLDDNIYEDEQQPSPGSDSFEMLNEPDLSDEFVIVEEVAKEAQEFDQEGKSLSIHQQPKKPAKKHDDDMDQYIIKSAPAATDAGSTYATNDINFEFDDSPPQDEENGEQLRGNGYSLEGSKRWVEMNLSDPANLRYPYDNMDRGILEDIKEEDTDFEVGSSRISSFKDSYSSTPDYEALVRKINARENDNISMSSLQEFESLEQVISLENRKHQTQSSQESLSNGSFPKRTIAKSLHGDDISLSSLKEFEGLENACIEAQLIEIRAKEEAAQLLSRSDDSSRSSGSSNGAKPSPKATASSSPNSGLKTSTTITKTTIVSGKSTALEQQMAQEFHKLQQRAQEIMEDNSISIMEASTDSLDDQKASKQPYDKTSSEHVSSDSLDNVRSATDIMTSSVDSIEASKGANAGTGKSSDVDSIEQNSPAKKSRSDSIDSIELQFAASQTYKMERDSIDEAVKIGISSTSDGKQIITQTVTKTSTVTSGGGAGSSGEATISSSVTHYEMPPKDISSDSLNRTEPELLLTSTESLETSSTATNATYQNETDSQMSGSITSCGSTTMIDTLDTSFPDFYSPSSSSHQIHQQQTSTTTTTYSYQEHELLDEETFSPITFNVTKKPHQ